MSQQAHLRRAKRSPTRWGIDEDALPFFTGEGKGEAPYAFDRVPDRPLRHRLGHL